MLACQMKLPLYCPMNCTYFRSTALKPSSERRFGAETRANNQKKANQTTNTEIK